MDKYIDKILDHFCDLIAYLFELLFSLIIKTDYEFEHVTDINDNKINLLKEEHNIKGFILDVDETIRFKMQSIPVEIKRWIKHLNKTGKIVVISNGYDKGIVDYFSVRGITVISFAFKPFKKCYLEACNEMNLLPTEVAVIGNNSLTDILGGKRLGMITIRIKRKKFKKD